MTTPLGGRGFALSSRSLISVVGAVLAGAIVLTALFAVQTLRDNSRRRWADEMSNLSLVLAEHVGQTLFSAHSVMDSLADEFKGERLQTRQDFERFAARQDINVAMVQRIRGNPIIDVASVVSLTGRVLNFTRSFPPPPINLSDRDYFQAHLGDATLDHYTSKPVRNKGDGKWLFYISQPVRNSRGELLGLLLVGVSVEWFSDFYRRISTQLGAGASISLWRSDFTLMTRWPFAQDQIGQINRKTATFDLIGTNKLDQGVETHKGMSEFSDLATVTRMTAPRVVTGFPFIVTPAITEEIFLRDWRDSVFWIGLTTAMSLAVLALMMRTLLRTERQLHDELQERRQAQALLHTAHEELEQRVAERTAALRREVADREVAQRELAQAQQHMAETSRRAGMAEVANSVLHNVGNVLNSVNVSVTLLGEQLRHSPLSDLPRATALLQAHTDDLPHYLREDPQGRQLPGFLVLLGQHWEKRHGLMQQEAAELTRSVQHIKDIVARQQSLSGLSGVVSRVNVAEVVDEVLAIHRRKLDSAGICVSKEHVGTPDWNGDRAKFTQILLNLVMNAEQALTATPPGGAARCIELSSTLRDDGSLLVGVQDNGPGMPPGVLDRLFSYGYTTKADGHGFGLHASALAAQEMGGSLVARSAGPGQGASFILDLPAAAPAAPPPAAPRAAPPAAPDPA
jgi:C4-dicarboxylate-specific signal transduction histidine kinase